MSIFKDTFHPSIKDQLNRRQNVINDRVSSKNIQYLNSRNAWIRLSSSVNIYSGAVDGDKKDPKNYTNALAKKNVLQGGVLKDYDKKTGTLRSGIGNDGAYSSYTRLGIRPMPGITSVDIKSEGAYGSLRKATVNFQCWDIQQLEDLELLYMRPGYTVLLEWGWVPYIDNTGEYKSTFTDYTDIIDTEWTKEELFSLQYAKSTDGVYRRQDGTQVTGSGYQGNYDSMFGYVKNYSWKARMDGGYDCMTEIISLGEVIESLKVNYAPLDNINETIKGGLVISNTNLSDEDKPKVIGNINLSGSYSENILAGIFTEMWGIGTYAIGDGSHLSLYDKKHKTYYDIFKKVININSENDNTNATGTGTTGKTDEQVYITLETLTHLLNNYVLLRDKKSTDKNQGKSQPFSSLSVLERDATNPNPKTGNGYLLGLAHPIQISTDVSTCLIKSPLWLGGLNLVGDTGSADPNQGDPTIKFSTTIGNVNTLVDQFIRILVPTSKITDTGKDRITNVIQGVIQGPSGSRYSKEQILNNIKEINRVYREKYADLTYKIGSPRQDEINFYGLTVNNSKVNISIPKAVNAPSFYALLSSIQGGNLGTDRVISILIPEDEIASIKDKRYFNTSTTYGLAAFGDPVEEERRRIRAEQEKIKATNERLQEGLKNIQFLNVLPRPYFVPPDAISETGPGWATELGIIGNIYVNVTMLYNLCTNNSLAAQDKKEKNDIALYDFIKNVLAKISTAIGNVNNFDIFVDPVDGVARIIDINYVDRVKAAQAYTNAFELQVQNTKSVVRSYGLESKIFKEQSTIVAIGAQVGGGALGTDTSTLVDFNRSIIDRIIPIKDAPTTNNEAPDDKAKVEVLLSSLNILANFFTDLSYYKFLGITLADPDFNLDQATKYSNALKDLINFFKTIGKSKIKNKAILPTVLSVNMDGIGGIVIGNIFKLPPDVLPKGYKNTDGIGSKSGYVVTGIGHSLQNNDWVTKIDAQFIGLDEPEGYDIDYSKITLSPLNTGTTVVVGIGGARAGAVTATTGKAKTYYPEKPEEQFRRTFIPQTQLADYLKKKVAAGLNKNIAIAVMAKSINEQGSGDQLKGFNNNFYGVQTDSSRWPAKYDPFISGNVFIAENKTNKQRAFAAFSTPEIGADFVIENVQRRGIYVGGTTTYVTKGTKVTDATLWARIYYKEWVTGNKNAEPDATTLKNLLSIYSKATKLIGQ